MEKEYKLKSVEMVSPKYKDALAILTRNVETLEIPDGTRTVPDEIFRELESLKKVIIPVSVSKLEGLCFYKCKNLTLVEYKGTVEGWNNIYQGYGCFHESGVTEIVCSNGTVPEVNS